MCVSARRNEIGPGPARRTAHARGRASDSERARNEKTKTDALIVTCREFATVLRLILVRAFGLVCAGSIRSSSGRPWRASSANASSTGHRRIVDWPPWRPARCVLVATTVGKLNCADRRNGPSVPQSNSYKYRVDKMRDSKPDMLMYDFCPCHFLPRRTAPHSPVGSGPNCAGGSRPWSMAIGRPRWVVAWLCHAPFRLKAIRPVRRLRP